jgi:hypothetical protein
MCVLPRYKFDVYGKSIPLISYILDEHRAKVRFVVFSRTGLNCHYYVMKTQHLTKKKQ